MSDRIALGVLSATFPPVVVDEVVEAASKREQRYRLLPARLVVYYVLAMSLFREAGYEEVMRQLTEGLGLDDDASVVKVPSSVAIPKERHRLGKEPLEALFIGVRVPLATSETRGPTTGAGGSCRWTGPSLMCPTRRATSRRSDVTTPGAGTLR